MARLSVLLRRFDRGFARGEAAIAALLLLVMVALAAGQALLRNLTNVGISGANEVLSLMEGADSFLQKGTLWLAFLGASLATQEDKQIAIDILPRLAPRRLRALMRGVVALAAGAVALSLSAVFWMAVLNNAQDRPLEYEVLVNGDAIHVCDAAVRALHDSDLERPTFFCAVRAGLRTLGAEVETPGAAAQLIVPVMFVVIAIRLFARGLINLRRLFGLGGDDDWESDSASGIEKMVEAEAEHTGKGGG